MPTDHGRERQFVSQLGALAEGEHLRTNSLLEGHLRQPKGSVKLRSAVAERHSQLTASALWKWADYVERNGMGGIVLQRVET